MSISDAEFKALFEARKRPADVPTIAKDTGLTRDEAKERLNKLVDEGLAVLVRQAKYAPIRLMGLVRCRALASPDAPAFARPLDGGADIYLDMPDAVALDGDIILVRLTQRGERARGTLTHVVRRAHTRLTGTLNIIPARGGGNKRAPKRGSRRAGAQNKPPRALAVIGDRRLPSPVEVEDFKGEARPGELCLFNVTRWPTRGLNMRVAIVQVLGRTDDVHALVRGLVAQAQIKCAFDPETLIEAEALPDAPGEEDMRERLDMRAREIFTIDGADAQDFDDAVSLEVADGKTVLGVHIADVAHYVKPDSALNAEARERGTSVYLPGLTIPMLPEALSNGLCSLKPHEDRLTYSLLMTLEGVDVKKYELRRAVIRSCARLTYEDVNAMLAGEASGVPENLRETLRAMNALARNLNQKRAARGALELDLPEPEFEIDISGAPKYVRARPRGDAHKLIEEFMLLANETVARHALRRELPFPYRIHEAPDAEKLAALESMTATLGRPHRLGAKPAPKQLQELIEDYKNRPESVIISRMLLRALSRARYLDKPLGHYGLATRDYCHFTSPIRRYPDLLAHRMLGMLEDGDLSKLAAWPERMEALTREASEREQAAASAERSADRMMCAAYLSERIGQRVRAKVISLGKHGAGVLLENTAEGRVPPQLMDDYYDTDEDRVMMVGKRSRNVVRLGDEIDLEVYSASAATGEIEFAMV